MTVLITADTVVTADVVLRPGWIEVVGDRIVAVGDGAPPRPADRALGAVTVVPGIWVSLVTYSALYAFLGVIVALLLLRQFRDSATGEPAPIPESQKA